MSLTEILINSQSADATIRTAAERQIEAAQNHLDSFIGSLISELGDENKPPHARMLAGTLLKNTMESRDPEKREQLAQRWRGVNAEMRSQVKQAVLETMGSKFPEARTVSAIVAATIARVELPYNEWPTFIPDLCNQALNNANADLRVDALRCVGYLCEEGGVDHSVLKPHSSTFANCLVSGTADGNPAIREMATKSLCNSLEFLDSIMVVEEQRTAVVDRIINCTEQTCNFQTRLAAMQCLVKVGALYYTSLTDQDVRKIFAATLPPLQNPTQGDEEQLALQSLEFWTAICDVEQELIEDDEMRPANEKQCKYLAKGAFTHLLPYLGAGLARQDEQAEENGWNISFASGRCLQSMSITIGEAVVEPVMTTLVRPHINSDSWRHREAALHSFGSIMEGPTTAGALGAALDNSVPTLIENVKSPHPLVQETAIWALGRIAEFHTPAVEPHAETFIKCMGTCLQMNPRMAAKACYSIHSLAKAFDDLEGEEEVRPTNVLSSYFLQLLQSLLAAADRPEGTDSNLRQCALEAISALVSGAAQDCVHNIADFSEPGFTPTLVRRLHNSLETYVQAARSSAEAARSVAETQGLYCAIINMILRKLETGAKNAPHSAEIIQEMMVTFMNLLDQPQTPVQEEVLLAIGALSTSLERDFAVFLGGSMPKLLAALRSFQSQSLCSVAVGSIVEIITAVQEHIEPHCDQLVQALLDGLKANELDPSVKPMMISAFGDIALAIGGKFQKYLANVMPVILYAVQTVEEAIRQAPSDETLEHYFLDLLENVCTCYTGIVVGMKHGSAQGALEPSVQQILQHVERIAQSPSTFTPQGLTVWTAAVSLVGDLANAYGPRMRQELEHRKPIVDLVNQGGTYQDEDLNLASQYALEQLRA
eukprot:TRINITY_DN2277_c3_g1_i1.p2 TRINITY_DN2277_c3_g1~~TRINITY_DN2277_c3_g1_i1.p2  ORF type:complete len:883 (+),score=372.60 TRINITY_DN2277_c3_g1_i1:220-2868(+)